MRYKLTGYTLIEVLIALAIVSIALTALIKVNTQHIRDTQYLEQKIKASWIAELILNEIRTEVRSPQEDETHEITFLNQAWAFRTQRFATPNPRIMKYQVDVMQTENTHPLFTLDSYVYAPNLTQ